MKQNPYRAILFDLDGTLVDSIPDLAAGANGMLAELCSTTLPVETISTYVGKGTEMLVRRCLQDTRIGLPTDDASVKKALEIFNRHYHAVNGNESKVYPGAIEGLEAFRAKGMKLAVVTNKPMEFTVPLLEKTGLAPYFDAVVGGDTCERKKPDPLPLLHTCELLDVQPDEALAVGDSINDALAARAAGIPVLAVPYGYNEGLDIHTLDIDGIVSGIDAAYRWAFEAAEQASTGA
ncbi:MAG TPA: phosphoglycolate phosphatase [Burkholderiaceae bacterium]|nr:phosphoglycolate phosphatase [Burkholderiaceae bacterium]